MLEWASKVEKMLEWARKVEKMLEWASKAICMSEKQRGKEKMLNKRAGKKLQPLQTCFRWMWVIFFLPSLPDTSYFVRSILPAAVINFSLLAIIFRTLDRE
eukprot:g51726.t1